jgi:hypothetical protein
VWGHPSHWQPGPRRQVRYQFGIQNNSPRFPSVKIRRFLYTYRDHLVESAGGWR